MNRIFSIVFFVLVFGGIAFLIINRCSKPGKVESNEISAKIFLVAYAGTNAEGKKIGCDDILVAVPVKLNVETSDIETTLNELIKQQDTSELHNFIKGPGLFLIQVLISDNLAEVYLKGDFDISTKCDIDRIREQLYATAKQFDEYKSVKFYIGDKTLEQYLSIAEAGFK